MPELLTLPPAGRYRIIVVDLEGRQDRGVGRRHVTFTGSTAEAHDRRADGPVMRSLEVLSVNVSSNKVTELIGESETWRLQRGCGCGG